MSGNKEHTKVRTRRLGFSKSLNMAKHFVVHKEWDIVRIYMFVSHIVLVSRDVYSVIVAFPGYIPRFAAVF